MSRPARALLSAGLLLWPALAAGQGSPRRPERPARQERPRVPDRSLMFECPLELTVDCRRSCPSADGHPDDSCPWRAFGCDFKICWGGTRMRVWGQEAADVVEDPGSYAVGGRLPLGGVNLVSIIRIVGPGVMPGLYLMGGRFVLDVPGLASRNQARALIEWGQRCAMKANEEAAEQVDRSGSGQAIQRVWGCDGRLRFSPVEAQPARQARAAPASASGGAPSAAPGTGVADVTRTVDEVRSLPDPELRRLLQDSGHVRLDGRVLAVDGVRVFSASADPEERERAMSWLDDAQRIALKELYSRMIDDALARAQEAEPAGPSQRYFYDDDTGEAQLRAAENGPVVGPKIPKGEEEPAASP